MNFVYFLISQKIVKILPSTKSSTVSVIFLDETVWRIGKNMSKETRPSFFWSAISLLTSASVGLVPRALRTSPTLLVC